MEPIQLRFDGGTLILTGGTPELLAALPGVRLDPRTGSHRAEARFYRAVVEHLHKRHPYEDHARAYEKTTWQLQSTREPFPHQLEGLEAWWNNKGRGVVVLPTGTGKT